MLIQPQTPEIIMPPALLMPVRDNGIMRGAGRGGMGGRGYKQDGGGGGGGGGSTIDGLYINIDHTNWVGLRNLFVKDTGGTEQVNNVVGYSNAGATGFADVAEDQLMTDSSYSGGVVAERLVDTGTNVGWSGGASGGIQIWVKFSTAFEPDYFRLAVHTGYTISGWVPDSTGNVTATDRNGNALNLTGPTSTSDYEDSDTTLFQWDITL